MNAYDADAYAAGHGALLPLMMADGFFAQPINGYETKLAHVLAHCHAMDAARTRTGAKKVLKDAAAFAMPCMGGYARTIGRLLLERPRNMVDASQTLGPYGYVARSGNWPHVSFPNRTVFHLGEGQVSGIGGTRHYSGTCPGLFAREDQQQPPYTDMNLERMRHAIVALAKEKGHDLDIAKVTVRRARDDEDMNRLFIEGGVHRSKNMVLAIIEVDDETRIIDNYYSHIDHARATDLPSKANRIVDQALAHGKYRDYKERAALEVGRMIRKQIARNGGMKLIAIKAPALHLYPKGKKEGITDTPGVSVQFIVSMMGNNLRPVMNQGTTSYAVGIVGKPIEQVAKMVTDHRRAMKAVRGDLVKEAHGHRVDVVTRRKLESMGLSVQDAVLKLSGKIYLSDQKWTSQYTSNATIEHEGQWISLSVTGGLLRGKFDIQKGLTWDKGLLGIENAEIPESVRMKLDGHPLKAVVGSDLLEDVIIRKTGRRGKGFSISTVPLLEPYVWPEGA